MLLFEVNKVAKIKNVLKAVLRKYSKGSTHIGNSEMFSLATTNCIPAYPSHGYPVSAPHVIEQFIGIMHSREMGCGGSTRRAWNPAFGSRALVDGWMMHDAGDLCS
jgi:hypothetical protein